jgi:DNA-binding beta-propeller fold protein YncE
MIVSRCLQAIGLSCLIALSVGCPKLAAAQGDAAGYRLSKTIRLGGNGSWDYLIADSAARRLYVTHYDRITVLDLDNGQVVGEIGGLQGVHGVAIDRESGRGFASNGKADSISIFDLQSLQVIGQAATGRNPDAIVYEPLTRRVFAFNHSGGDVTVINAGDGSAAGTVEVGGELEYAVSDDAGTLFVNVEDRSEIVRINRQLEIVSRWPLAPCEEPTGLALDHLNRRLFSTCGNGMLLVVDADDGHIVSKLPIGNGCDGVRFDSKTRRIFTSNGQGTLSIIQQDAADQYRLLGDVPTQRGARTLELDLPTHRIFTATANLGPMPEARPGERARPEILPDSFVVLEYSLAP